MEVTAFECDLDEAAVFRERAPSFGITPIITASPVSDVTAGPGANSRCISVGHKTAIGRSELTRLAAAGVRYISTRSVGVNHIDVPVATSLGITVAPVAYSPDSVADHALMLILMSLRNARSVLHAVESHDYRPHPVRGRELRDLTVGVVGTGRIGTAVIQRLQGFGCRILAWDVRPGDGAEYVALDELLQRSDIVTLHVPLDESTFHLVDREALDLLPARAHVVNTGRGALIDTEALLDALRSGHLAGAALDVVEGEEDVFYTDRRRRPIDGILLRLHHRPDVLLTPHVAYYTDHAVEDAVVNSLINCLSFEKGRQHD
jgi:D-specific alpha-keto acid dehydrogenase